MNLVVSSGPAPVSVPNVVGLTQAAATTAIQNAGLLVGTVTTTLSNPVATGNVISEKSGSRDLGGARFGGQSGGINWAGGYRCDLPGHHHSVGLVYNRTTNTFDSLLTITRSSISILAGPLILVISQITPSSVTPSNPTGLTSSGNPYISLTVPAGGLSPGQSIPSVLLKFSDPNRVAFTFNR